MKILLVAGSIILPAIMLFVSKKWPIFRLIFHVLAIISALIFGNIASVAIYNILRDDAVFMTSIHGIFLNPSFLITGAYLGVYLIYILGLSVFKESAKGNSQ